MLRRLFWIWLGLALIAAGILVLVHDPAAPGRDTPPLDQIDAESRRQLERVLIDAERNEAGESR